MSFHWIERMIVTTTGKDKEEEWPWKRNLGTNLRDSEAESKGEEKPVLLKTKALKFAKANFPSDTTAHYLLLNSLLFKPTLRLSNQPFFYALTLCRRSLPLTTTEFPKETQQKQLKSHCFLKVRQSLCQPIKSNSVWKYMRRAISTILSSSQSICMPGTLYWGLNPCSDSKRWYLYYYLPFSKS